MQFIIFRLAFLIIGTLICLATWYFYRLYSTNEGDNFVVTGTITHIHQYQSGRKTYTNIDLIYLSDSGEEIKKYMNTDKNMSRYNVGDRLKVILSRNNYRSPVPYSHYRYWGGIVLMGVIGFCFVFVALFSGLIMDGAVRSAQGS